MNVKAQIGYTSKIEFYEPIIIHRCKINDITNNDEEHSRSVVEC